MLEELLQHFATAASAAVMVGDTHYDMAMAQALGMPRVAVSYGAHRREQLLPYAPLACLDQLAELPSVLSIN